MMPKSKGGAGSKPAPARFPTGRPLEVAGTPAQGRIVSLLVGQGHGYIRLDTGGDVFFHRSDVRDGVSFNQFSVGDIVRFDLLDDRVSGPRALRVGPRRNDR